MEGFMEFLRQFVRWYEDYLQPLVNRFKSTCGKVSSKRGLSTYNPTLLFITTFNSLPPLCMKQLELLALP